MFLIFDLDDTLVDTSRCLTPIHTRQIFAKMGLGDDDYERFCKVNETALSTSDALKKMGLDPSYAKLPIDGEFEVEPVPGARELLDGLKEKHTLALVTIGNEEFQRIKLEKAGIQPAIFSKLVFGDGPSKKGIYKDLLDEIGFEPSDALVCGDRVPIDLTPAKELGMTTVHLANGRGKVHYKPSEDVDYAIESLNELTRVIHESESRLNQ